MKIGAIIQARTASTRLSGKVLKELPCGSGITVLEQVIRRLKGSSRIDDIIVATTKDVEDEKIVEIAEKEGVGWFRGSRDDVLSRYFLAAGENDLDIIVRITSDCPCMDPEVVDCVIESYVRGERVDYVSNTLKRTYPHGLDTEVFSREILETSFKEARESSAREHVTPYIYNSGKFEVRNEEAPEGLKRPDIRITLDTREDYALLCAVFEFLYYENPSFRAVDIIGLFDKKPWLGYINKKVTQKETFHSLEEELKAAVKVLDLQDLKRARDFIAERLA